MPKNLWYPFATLPNNIKSLHYLTKSLSLMAPACSQNSFLQEELEFFQVLSSLPIHCTNRGLSYFCTFCRVPSSISYHYQPIITSACWRIIRSSFCIELHMARSINLNTNKSPSVTVGRGNFATWRPRPGAHTQITTVTSRAGVWEPQSASLKETRPSASFLLTELLDSSLKKRTNYLLTPSLRTVVVEFV